MTVTAAAPYGASRHRFHGAKVLPAGSVQHDPLQPQRPRDYGAAAMTRSDRGLAVVRPAHHATGRGPPLVSHGPSNDPVRPGWCRRWADGCSFLLIHGRMAPWMNHAAGGGLW